MIAILKYNAGNATSVANAIKKIGYEVLITDHKEALQKADKVIFPGAGEARSAMNYLNKTGLDQIIISLTQPVLGICLGMQLLCSHSEERNTPCLGIFPAKVRLFPPKDIVPHTGWNTLSNTDGVLFKDLQKESDCYFVHSYYAELCENTVATCDYILPYSVALQKDNFYAVQFHPEKSGSVGMKILQNFLAL
ncbi:MAG: imidazole glycerol phosphate synthase subunit HisH [Bacteroidetes bacterium]|nr:imidazole glycerol phosphate synthase subunit HisH [Bacteroidota bacterium]